MADTRLIHGFHAVTAKLRHAPEDVKELYVAEGRQDGRVRDLLKVAEAAGVRVIPTDMPRLDGMAGSARHQGVVARVSATQKHLTLDDVLEPLTEVPLLLVLDGVHGSAQPRRLPARGRCRRCACGGGAEGPRLRP